MAATLSTTIYPSARIATPARPTVRHLVAPAAAVAVLAALIALLPGIAHVPATDVIARPMGTPAISVDATRPAPTEVPATPAHAQPGLDR
ncbi:MAG TPA: hypothetical protein VFJ80_12325 [Candidatus Limnocylindrales bacterium]|jgi:hypothetical protein|nr:hypothetical protein [Candidatus Limnocylindrales bacterium]